MRLQNLIKKLLKIIDKMVTKNGLSSAFIYGIYHQELKPCIYVLAPFGICVSALKTFR